jgi:hypothetical protein
MKGFKQSGRKADHSLSNFELRMKGYKLQFTPPHNFSYDLIFIFSSNSYTLRTIISRLTFSVIVIQINELYTG